MLDLLVRFAIGGLVVSLFAIVGDLFKPKSFGGLFGAAPSVAIATLSLTTYKEGWLFAGVEARSMILGAVALLAYAQYVCWVMMRRRQRALRSTLVALPVWFAVAFGCWAVFVR
jgi:hypothetical protein